jgi:hypothetical protein
MHGVNRTGVRFVMSSPSDPDRVDDYHAWYDTYATVVAHLGHLVNCFRFENPAASSGHPRCWDTGLFYTASRFELIEGFPEASTWLEIFETDQQDPLTAYSRTLDALAGSRRAAEIRERRAGSFQFYSAYISGH